MKKILLSIAFALLGFSSSFAAKAYPGPINVIQSDGTTLTVYLHGDENFSWSSASDGTLLVQVGKNYYVAQVEEDGTLKATPQLAHNPESRSAIEKNVAEAQDKDSFFKSTDARLQSLAKSLNTDINSNRSYFPHNGAPRALVILVQFPDCKFLSKDPKTAFHYFLNAEGGEQAPEALTSTYRNSNYGSVKQYFMEMSKGDFTPVFDVAGVVTVSKSYSYYGEESKTNPNTHDVNCQDMVVEACQLAKSELGVNFSDYDLNHDGKADLVYIIHAGIGQNVGGAANTIWAKTDAGANLTIDNNTQIYSYGVNCELNTPDNIGNTNYLTGIGVFCHEFSHCMGMPDLYPYNKAAYVNNQEPEYWDLMDAGEYYNNGYQPAPYSPWELDIMGWDSDIEVLGNTPQQITLQPYSQERKAYKIEASDGQYVLLQNVQKLDWWRGLPSHGLLIHRIDYNRGNVGLDYRMNQTPGKPEVTIYPADGIIINSNLSGDGNTYTKEQYMYSHWGDPYPGQKWVGKDNSGKNIFEPLNATSIKEFALNNGVVINAPIYNIKENNGIITFDYLKDFTTGIDSPITNVEADKDASIYTLDGRYLGTDASKLTKGLYIIGKKKVIIK